MIFIYQSEQKRESICDPHNLAELSAIQGWHSGGAKLTRPRARLVPHQPSAQPSQFLIPCGQGLRLGKPKMDEWKGITSHDALQRFLVLILLCLVILLLIAAAVWYIA